MPGLDHKGPQGEGPRSGRQMGNCKPISEENETQANDMGSGTERGMGRGLGRGPGRGRGRGFGRGKGRSFGNKK